MAGGNPHFPGQPATSAPRAVSAELLVPKYSGTRGKPKMNTRQTQSLLGLRLLGVGLLEPVRRIEQLFRTPVRIQFVHLGVGLLEPVRRIEHLTPTPVRIQFAHPKLKVV